MKLSFPDLQPPQTRIETVTKTTHAIERHDDYAWLRADNWQEVFQNPDVLPQDIRAHLDAENLYYRQMMADTEDLQQDLFSELRGRIKEDDSSVPVKDGPYCYGSAFNKGDQYPHFYRMPRDGGTKTIYLDGNKEAQNKSYFQFGDTNYAPDHNKCAWSYDDKGSEYFTITIRNMETLRDMDDLLTNTGGSAVWDADSQGLFYTLVDDNHRPSKLYYHKLGTEQSQDILIFEETDPGFFMQASGSLLNDYIFIDIHDHETSEVWVLPANDPQAKPVCIAPRRKGIEYSVCEGGDVFYILTNMDGAKDFKIMVAPASAPQVENWQPLIEHKPGRLILAHGAYKRHLVWLEREDGLPRIVIHNRQSGANHAIAFDEEAYSLGLQGSAEYDSDTIRFSYSSPTTPTQIFDYNMQKRERILMKTQEIPSGHNPDLYITKRVFATALDGEQIPITLLYHKDTPLDGTAPCALYGYGAYGITIPASFNANHLSLANRGFVCATAHIRGGKDKGFYWYENGKRHNKPNTFKDFIAAGRYLVSQNYTSHDRLIAYGGSAGGLLIGAVANMAPQDYGALIAIVPFVDVLNTMLDDTLPLTPPEWPEWGNPITNEEDYKLIASYSPYDNISKQAYPPILAIGGLTDPRVTYWEPAKWVARLRHEKSNDAPILLKTNMENGHGGASGRFERLRETALIYAFMLKAISPLLGETT